MMKNYILLLVLLFAMKSSTVHAAVNPSALSGPPTATISLPAQFATMSMKQIQKLAGRKFTLKEKIGIKALQWKLKKELKRAGDEKKDNTGTLALIFSIIGLAALVSIFVFGVGGLGLLAILGTLLGLIFGNKAKRDDPDNKDAKTAVLLGWISLGLIFISLVLLLIAFSSINWSFG